MKNVKLTSLTNKKYKYRDMERLLTYIVLKFDNSDFSGLLKIFKLVILIIS